MQKSLIRNITEPLLARVGTATSAALVGYGMAEHQATAVGAAVVIIIGFGIDLAIRKWLKRDG